MKNDILKMEIDKIDKDVLKFFLKLFKLEYVNYKVDKQIIINILNTLEKLVRNSNG